MSKNNPASDNQDQNLNAETVAKLLDDLTEILDQQEQDPAWQENNLEYDLISSDWLVSKVRASESYAQNLYAALCNNEFQKLDAWQILNDRIWHCSWRYAGGIVADILGSGDYLDWYCSGSGIVVFSEEHKLTDQEQKFVAEGVVTDEIREDLRKLGWLVRQDSQSD